VKLLESSAPLTSLPAVTFPVIAVPSTHAIFSLNISPTIQHHAKPISPGKGISTGCSLSPLLAEFYLRELDRAFDHNPNIYYQRFCDDIIVLTKTKWQQKWAIRKIKQVLYRLKLTIRYRKTFTGKTSDIIVYLGYKIYPNRTIGISSESIKRMKLNLLRLYEQGSSPERIRSYLRRWQGAFVVTT